MAGCHGGACSQRRAASLTGVPPAACLVACLKGGDDKRQATRQAAEPLAAAVSAFRRLVVPGKKGSARTGGFVHSPPPGVAASLGPAEISGNAVRDLAALCKQEMLNWDEWGRMPERFAVLRHGRMSPSGDWQRGVGNRASPCRLRS